MTRYLLAVALAVVLVTSARAHAATSPAVATRTLAATATATLVPRSTATATTPPTASPTPTPSPSPSPTPATIGGSGGSGSSCPHGIALPVPFTGGWCLDPWQLLTTGLTSIWTGLGSDLQHWMTDLTTAILSPLVRTDNPADNPALASIYRGLATDATYVFVVLFGLGALWSAVPAMFGKVEDGLALLLCAGGVMAALHAFPVLLTVWIAAVNGLSSDIGTAAIGNTAHDVVTLIFAPLLLFLAGLERAVSLHLFAFLYEIAPLAMVCFVWPPARGIGVAWLRTFLYLSLLGPGYELMVHTISAVGDGSTGLWSDILFLGGLLVLDLLPAILAGLFSVASHAVVNMSGQLSNVAIGGVTRGIR